MPKITLLGAGSGFTQPLFTDMLHIEGIEKGVIGLVDIDEKRLGINVKLIERILGLMGKTGWTVEASSDRKKILPGTDYLISTIEVSGTQCVRWDNDIPMEYGIDQCIGDTIGPGGVMKALRTLPPLLEILADAERLCPQALVMNYTNPMSIITQGATRSSTLPFVGLCHSVQGSWRQVARAAGIPDEKMDQVKWRCAGINHLAWYTEMTYRGRDIYPDAIAGIEDPAIYENDPVRYEMMRQFGYFVTESSGHFSEYVPYFRKRKDLLKTYCRDGYRGGSSFYADNWPDWRKATDKRRRAMANGKEEIALRRSHEYAADIVEAHHFHRPTVIHASAPNNDLVTNLPRDGVVEVAVLVDRNGYTPTHFGDLPEQCAALDRAHMAVYKLCADGILHQDREALIHAMMLDPLSAAVCSPAEIREMAEKLFAAEKRYIPAWAAKKPKARRKPRKAAGRGKRRKAATTDAAAEVSSMAARNVQK
ncbi:MAG: alpha-glucosidase/alpha-galactosidase [Planctomycetota bacterium]